MTIDKQHYEAFFEIKEPTFIEKSIFALSHFYPRIKTYVNANPFDSIFTKDKAQVFVGQIPIREFSDAMLAKLPTNSLVVSCVDYFELAGNGNLYTIIQPHSWELLGFQHHHLPVADYSLDANLHLVVEALIKMKESAESGQSIYIHCKAGAGRSPFIAALLHCIMYYNIDNASDGELENYINASIATVKAKRTLITNLTANLSYALDIIKAYRERKKSASLVESSSQFFAKLVKATEFKAFSLFAYHNSKYFAPVKKVLKELYQNHEAFLTTLNEQIEAIKAADREGVVPNEAQKNKPKEELTLIKAIETLYKDNKSQRALLNLKAYLENKAKPKNALQNIFEQVHKTLNMHPYNDGSNSEIRANAYLLVNEIWLSNLSNDKKKELLSKTIDFLNKPIEKAESYINDSIAATYFSAKMGKLMLLLSLSVLAIAISLAFVFPAIIPAMTCLLLISPIVIFAGSYMICSAPKEILLAPDETATLEETPLLASP